MARRKRKIPGTVSLSKNTHPGARLVGRTVQCSELTEAGATESMSDAVPLFYENRTPELQLVNANLASRLNSSE